MRKSQRGCAYAIKLSSHPRHSREIALEKQLEASSHGTPRSSRYTFLITRWIYSWHPAWRLTSSTTTTTTTSQPPAVRPCEQVRKPLSVFLSRRFRFNNRCEAASCSALWQLVVQSRKKLSCFTIIAKRYFVLRLVSSSTGMRERTVRFSEG